MNKIPVGQTIGYAYGFTFGQLGTVIGIAWLPLLIAEAASYSLYDLSGLATITPDQMRGNPGLALRSVGVGLISYAILQFFNAVVAVAIIRHALGMRSGPVRIHLAAGWDEWRLFAGYVRYFFAALGIFVISYIIVAVVGLAFTFVMQGGGPAVAGIGGLVVIGVLIAVYCAAILTLVRMGYLLSPSIVGEKGGGIKRSYELTKGNFWRIAGVWLATGLPPLLLLAGAEYALVAPHINFDPGPWPQTPDAVQEFTRRLDGQMAAVQAEIVRQRIPLQVCAYVYGVLSAGLYFGATAFAYRSLVPAADLPRQEEAR